MGIIFEESRVNRQQKFELKKGVAPVFLLRYARLHHHFAVRTGGRRKLCGSQAARKIRTDWRQQ